MARKDGVGKHRAQSIAQVEWNFDGIPALELLPCLYYEYAREATWIHDDLRSVAQESFARLSILPQAVTTVLRGMERHGFPATPWARLPKDVRKEATGWFFTIDQSVTPDIGFGDATKNLIQNEVKGGPRVSEALQNNWTDGYDFRIFRFNWTLSPEEFGKLCKEWFEENQPLEFKAAAKRRAQYQAPGFSALLYPPIEALRYLGVERRWKILPKNSGWAEFSAAWPNEYPLDGKDRTDPKNKRSRISRDRRLAKKMLDSLYPKSPGHPSA